MLVQRRRQRGKANRQIDVDSACEDQRLTIAQARYESKLFIRYGPSKSLRLYLELFDLGESNPATLIGSEGEPAQVQYELTRAAPDEQELLQT